MKRTGIRGMLAGAILAVVPIALADGIEWPADFWSQVSNRVSAVPPVPVTSSPTSAFSSRASAAASLAIGTSQAPFDTRALVKAWAEAFFHDASAVFSIILR